ncbi:MAG: hypothetical protein GX440_08480, partial [Propionibacterium sp.]|nr:hypothetical protein [Propionibacterium sp.]
MALISVMVVLLTSLSLVSAPNAFAVGTQDCAGGAIQIIAHQDDDLLFQSPDLLRDVDAGRCVRSVFVTAGDSGYGNDYWQSREEGAEAAWADMAGVDDDWSTSTISLGGKSVRLRTLNDSPNVSLVFMRLPDGFPLGTGSAARGYQSLYRLLTGAISSISAVDGSASYTASSLRSALLDVVQDKDSTWIRTQNYVSYYGADQDHYDHHSVAYLARDTMNAYENDVILSSYLGYGDFVNNGAWPQNIFGSDLDRKESAFDAYAGYDDEVDWDEYWSRGWIQRQYVINISRSTSAANAGSDQEVGAGTLVTLDGTGSTGVSGLSYSWRQTAGPTVTLSSSTSSRPTFTPTAAGDYTFDLTVTGGGATSTDDVTITVNSNPPVVSAGENQSVVTNALVTLDGSNSTTPTGALTYRWEQTSGPSVTLSSATVVKPTFTPTAAGTYVFKLTVSSPTGTATGTVTITATAPQNPVANAGPDQSVYTGDQVTLDASGSTNPNPGTTLTYAWTQISGAAVTLSNATIAKPTFIAPITEGTYVFQLTVASAGLSSTDTMTVTATKEVISFTDVDANNQFYTEIMWLADQGVTTGWKLSNGTREFRPVQPVARDAMAAFLYRLAGSPAYTPPTTSPFTDVGTDNVYYKEIAWLNSTQITTGYPDGTYRPLESVNRDAMAA